MCVNWLIVLTNWHCKGCSLNIVFFSPSPVLGCYRLYKKLKANRSDCTLALRWELLKVSYSDVGEGGIEVNCEKKQFSMNTLYLQCTAVSHTKTHHYPRSGHMFAGQPTPLWAGLELMLNIDDQVYQVEQTTRITCNFWQLKSTFINK